MFKHHIVTYAFTIFVSAAALVFPVLIAPLPTAHAATLAVNTLADGDDGACDAANCTLREAITYAAPGDTVTFNVTGIITLTNGQITISKNLTITGPTAGGIVIMGTASSRAFEVTSATVTFEYLTISSGNAPNFGGGVYNYSGTVTIRNSTISGNNASFNGGGIYNYTGTVTILNSTISGNYAVFNGGGIYNYTGTVTIQNSTISGNKGDLNGGGIYESPSSMTNITNSTVTGNGALGFGGGGYLAGTSTLTYVTMTGNSSNVDTLNNGREGGGIAAAGTVSLFGTILYGNFGYNYLPSNANDCLISGGSITSNGYNIIGVPCGITQQSTDQNNISPMLGSLANNGGLTQTFALLTGSPAIDAIPAANCAVTIDQRGEPRPTDGNNDNILGCDIGSFEVNSPVVYPATPTTSAGAPTFPTPQPIALCADLNGTTNPIVRADVLGGTVTNGDVFCRVITENSEYVSPNGAADIGNMDVINLGVIQAVDVFGLSGGQSVPRFNSSVKICLQGSGRFLYLDATTAPRALSELPATGENGYTCARIYNAGTVVLVP